MKWLTRYREIIVPLLVVVAVSFTLANLLKYGVLSSSQLAKNKDALSALNSAVNVVVIIIGAIFSYYRFFRGRTFFSRAELSLFASVLDTTKDFNIHFLTLEVKNIGALSIWDPLPVMDMYKHGPNGITHDVWENWREATTSIGEAGMLPVIDSGEIASFITYEEVDKSIWAVEYVAFVKSQGRTIWKRAITVPNIPKDRLPSAVDQDLRTGA
jgi:hypothetical protein